MTANIRAYKADMELTKHCMVAYGPEHNTDMLIYAANMAGMVRPHQDACPGITHHNKQPLSVRASLTQVEGEVCSSACAW